MPQFQILPPNPGFGSQLGQALGEGIGSGLSQGINAFYQKKDREREREEQKKLIEHYGKLSGFFQGPEHRSSPDDWRKIIEELEIETPQQSIPDLLEGMKDASQEGAEVLRGKETAPEQEKFSLEEEKGPRDLTKLKEAFTFERPQAPFVPTRLEDFSKIAAMNQKDRLQAEKTAAPLMKQIDDEAKGARRQLDSIRLMEKALESGKGGPLSWDALMGKLGIRSWMSEEGQLFQSQLLNYMEGMRDLFGVRITDADLKLILDKLPDIARNPRVNRMIMDTFKLNSAYQLARKKAKDLILSKASKEGIFPKDLDRRIDSVLEYTFEPHREKSLTNIEGIISAARGEKESMLSPRSFSKGDRRKNKKTGETQVWTGREWRKVK